MSVGGEVFGRCLGSELRGEVSHSLLASAIVLSGTGSIRLTSFRFSAISMAFGGSQVYEYAIIVGTCQRSD